jgi:signal transduction histidine kinase
MRSLRGRLTLGLLVTLLVAFVTQWLVVHQGIAGLIREQIGGRLEHDSNQLLAALSFDPGTGTAVLDVNRPGAVYRQPYSGHYYWLHVGEREFRSRSLWDVALAPPRHEGTRELDGPRGQRLLVFSRRYLKEGRAVEIAVAEDLSPLRRQIWQLQFRYAMLTAALLLLLLIAQRVIVQRELRPLERLRQELGELSAGTRSTLEVTGVPVEVRPLVNEFNHLIDLLRQRLARSRVALGNLAHAVKTPLTLLSQQVEQAGAMPPQWRKEAESQIDLLRQRVERELGRARLAGPVAPGKRFSVTRDLPPLLDALRRLHAERGIVIDSGCCDAGECSHDRDDMLELLGNLLDNACKWARRRASITLGKEGGCHIAVEDDGPGVDDADAAALTDRGNRLDEGRPGHGLGLAIVADIVEQYGGRLQLGRSTALGGLRVEVWLPRGGVPEHSPVTE